MGEGGGGGESGARAAVPAAVGGATVRERWSGTWGSAGYDTSCMRWPDGRSWSTDRDVHRARPCGNGRWRRAPSPAAMSTTHVRETCCLLYGSHRPPRKLAASSQSLLLHVADRELVKRVDGGMQMPLGQVHIDGRVFQSLMPHQQLDGTQVGSTFQQMRGEAMPERMGAKLLLNARAGGRRPADVPHRLVGDRLLAAGLGKRQIIESQITPLQRLLVEEP